MSIFAVFASLIGIAVVVFVIVGPATIWRQIYGDPDLGPFELATLERSARPHDGLLSTPGACPPSLKADGELPSFEDDPASVLTRLAEHIKALDGAPTPFSDNIANGSIRYVTWSPTMKFPDTTQFWAIPLADGKTGLVAYAKAQVGHSDFGVNLHRLKTWTEGFS
ncbi:MAG: DUF1499 domain-containing protein [Pseudomonadota bacterium]